MSVSMFASVPTFAAGYVGNYQPGSYTEAALDSALVGGGTVTFRCNAPGTIITTTDGKTISQSTTLVSEHGPVTLSLNTAADPVIYVSDGADFTANNVNFTGGRDGISGFGKGLITLTNSYVYNNQEHGIRISDMDLNLTDSTFSGNSKGGINRVNGSDYIPTFLIQGSTIESNGLNGIDGWGRENYIIRRSKISQNANFGLYVSGTIEISDSIISDNTGWGLELNRELSGISIDGISSISGSTISGNARGISFGGTLNLVNSTVSNNIGFAVRTNGLYEATANITSSTVVDNGQGLHHWSSEGSFNVKNSLGACRT